MHAFQFLSLPLALLFVQAVTAGQNCKCQDPSGTGAQYNDLTQQCCSDERIQTCPPWGGYYPGPNHQCSAGGSNCLDSGAFDSCCRSLGGPGAYCWN